jgi:hypothetical protein
MSLITILMRPPKQLTVRVVERQNLDNTCAAAWSRNSDLNVFHFNSDPSPVLRKFDGLGNGGAVDLLHVRRLCREKASCQKYEYSSHSTKLMVELYIFQTLGGLYPKLKR